MNYTAEELSGSEDGSHIFEVFSQCFRIMDISVNFFVIFLLLYALRSFDRQLVY